MGEVGDHQGAAVTGGHFAGSQETEREQAIGTRQESCAYDVPTRTSQSSFGRVDDRGS